MDFVVDSSIVLSWLLEDEKSAAADCLLTDRWAKGADLHAPALLRFEVANVLVICHTRRQRLSCDELAKKLAEFENLQVAYDAPDTPLARTAELAVTHGLTGYDAAYLELAERLRLPLATADELLRQAAQQLHIPLLP